MTGRNYRVLKLKLHHRILIGMAIGFVVGVVLHFALNHETTMFTQIVWWLDLLGKDLFIGALKMIIAPLILASIVAGISSLPSAGALGNIGLKTVAYYMTTTAVAVGIGVIVITILRPGYSDAALEIRSARQAELEVLRQEFLSESGTAGDTGDDAAYRVWLAERSSSNQADFADKLADMDDASALGIGAILREKLVLPVLDNPFHALAGSPPNTLGIIAFAVLLGLACLALGDKVATVTRFFTGLYEIMLTITGWVMEIAPLAIGCIIASIMATFGFQALNTLAWYTFGVILALGIHMVFLLCIVKVVSGIGPRKFVAGMRDAWLISFSTASSTATLPVSIRCVTENLGVSPKVADFSMPVGATVNMDGSALYEAVGILFVVQVYGGLADVPIVLDFGNTLIIAVTAVVTSIGVAAVPSAALITMAIIASAIGLPFHYIAIIYAVDHLLDMFRTTVNVTGDAVGAVVVNAWERKRLAEEVVT